MYQLNIIKKRTTLHEMELLKVYSIQEQYGRKICKKYLLNKKGLQ